MNHKFKTFRTLDTTEENSLLCKLNNKYNTLILIEFNCIEFSPNFY